MKDSAPPSPQEDGSHNDMRGNCPFCGERPRCACDDAAPAPHDTLRGPTDAMVRAGFKAARSWGKVVGDLDGPPGMVFDVGEHPNEFIGEILRAALAAQTGGDEALREADLDGAGALFGFRIVDRGPEDSHKMVVIYIEDDAWWGEVTRVSHIWLDDLARVISKAQAALSSRPPGGAATKGGSNE